MLNDIAVRLELRHLILPEEAILRDSSTSLGMTKEKARHGHPERLVEAYCRGVCAKRLILDPALAAASAATMLGMTPIG
jgi:hypothetical protein